MKTQAQIKKQWEKHWRWFTAIFLLGLLIGLNIPLPKGKPIMTATIKIEKVVTPTITPTAIPTPTIKPDVKGTSTYGFAIAQQSYMLQLVNQTRAQYGLRPLTEIVVLDNSAWIKANDEATHNYFAHTNSSGGWFGIFFKQAGFYNAGIAENLGRGYPDSNALLQAFMASPEHRANILEPNATYFGFAEVGNYEVMHFGATW